MNLLSQEGGDAPREQYIAWIGHVAQCLLAGRPPDPTAAKFVGSALSSYLSSGGSTDLCRDHFKIVLNGSHRTPSRVWLRELAPLIGGHEDAADDIVVPGHDRRQEHET